MSEQNKQPLDTQSDSIEQKSKQLDQLERESDQERPTVGESVNVYSNQGLHSETADDEVNDDAFTGNEDDPDQYGSQDPFGDVDGQDPYDNLDDEDAQPSEEEAFEQEEGLYGLAEPLAREGDVSRQGSDKDRYGTERSQDQQGNQQ